MSASREPAWTSPRAAQLGFLVSKHVMVVMRSCSPPANASRICGRERPYQPAQREHKWCCPYCCPIASGSRVERAELARLELALELSVDLVLGRVGIGVAQLPRAQPAQLEDLQHEHEVGA